MTGKVCFVLTDQRSESSMWLSYAAQGLKAPTTTFSRLNQGLDLGFDTYVIERETWNVPWRRLSSRKVLCWVDDAYHLMPHMSHNHRQWREGFSTFAHYMKRCAGLIAPSVHLLSDYADYLGSPNLFFIPNYHNFPTIIPNTLSRGGAYKFSPAVGWGGSWNHWLSWRGTRLHQYLPYGGSVTTIVGHRPVYELVRKFDPRARFVPALPLEEYLKRIGTWDLHLIPVHGPYDKRRSWIKALEAAYCGTLWAACGDAASIYEGCVGGKFFDSAPSMVAWLNDTSAINRYGDKEAQDAHEWAESQRITNHLDEWLSIL